MAKNSQKYNAVCFTENILFSQIKMSRVWIHIQKKKHQNYWNIFLGTRDQKIFFGNKPWFDLIDFSRYFIFSNFLFYKLWHFHHQALNLNFWKKSRNTVTTATRKSCNEVTGKQICKSVNKSSRKFFIGEVWRLAKICFTVLF